jgi:superfamily II DNA or RNA helicase
MRLRDYQQRAVDAVFAYWSGGGSGSPLVVLPTGCHAKGTRVLLSDGRMRAVEDVRVGDMLLGVGGEPRTVLALCRGRQQMARVVPVKGDPFVVNMDHVLSLAATSDGKDFPSSSRAGTVVNVTVREWMTWAKSRKHLFKIYRSSGVDFRVQDNPMPVDPYFLGLMIGDGHIGVGGTMNVTSMDDEIKEAFTSYVKRWGGTVRVGQKKGNKASQLNARGAMSLRDALGHIGVDVVGVRKHIPHRYKVASTEARLAILAGLMDTDGHMNHGFDYISVSKRLADDVAYVARSLGFSAYVAPCRKGCQTGAIGDYYRVSINGDVHRIPTRLARKKAPPREQKKRVTVTGFHVETLEEDDFYGFTIDGDHLYHLDDFTVTHNSGKSAVLAAASARLVGDFGARVIVATHRKELIAQDAAAVRRFDPALNVGMWSAGVGEKRVGDVTVAGVQSAWRQTAAFGHVDVLVVDEAHLVSTDDASMYGKLIAGLRRVNPDMRLLGLTATHYRMGQGYLTQGEGALFSSVVCRIGERELVDAAWLAPLTAGRASAQVDTSDVATSGGDFVARDLELAADLDEVNGAVARDVADALASGRHMAMVFCVGVDHAGHMRAALQMAGVRSEVVTGETAGRDRVIEDFKRGAFPCLVSCDVLTTGFDAPGVDVLAVVRPTKSPGLYVQIMGRGMRPVYAPGMPTDTVEERRAAMAAGPKPHGCMVLDYGGNVARHGPITDVRVPEKRGGGTGEAVTRTCPQCFAEVAASARACPECDHEFPPPEKKANAKASQLDPLGNGKPKEDAKPTTYRVGDVDVGSHVGKSGVPSMRVTFFSHARARLHSEFVCLEHDGFARTKAEKVWGALFDGPCPLTVDEGVQAYLDGRMRDVEEVTLKPDGQWSRMVSVKVRDREPGEDEKPRDAEEADPFDGDQIPF